MIKVHTIEGCEMYLNPRYVVWFSDHRIIVDDYIYNPDFKMPESKRCLNVLETAKEIADMINGDASIADLDKKYNEEFARAKNEHAETYPF